MQFTKFFFAGLVAALPATAITSFRGDDCDGFEGDDVACNGACISFSGRHSFRVGGGSNCNCVEMFSNGDCTGSRFDFPNEGTNCQNVNTGGPANSFRCFSNNQCA
ncbi:hypothetical protein AURDEDRAFT_166527 [Auricularia subglabra TFB-10046 SS5]|nr:hypothetical protein AURDEDRAFT_166527 [Auricularia subglabra TFB-10046 SS5]